MHPSCRFCHSLWQNQFQELGQLQGPRNGSDPLTVELQTRQVLGQRAVRGIPNLDRSRETWRDSGVEGDSSAQPRTRRGPCTPPGSQEGALTSLGDAKVTVPSPTLSPELLPPYADGFDLYVRDLYLHRLRQERKTHVVKCLAKQPEVCTFLFFFVVILLFSIFLGQLIDCLLIFLLRLGS